MTKTDKNEKTLEELQPTVEALATNLDQILGEVVTRFEFDKLKKEIEELKGNLGKKWQTCSIFGETRTETY